MQVCAYMLTGIGIAPCDQVAAGHRRHRGERTYMLADLDLDHREVSAHRTINMQADTDPRPRPTTGRI